MIGKRRQRRAKQGGSITMWRTEEGAQRMGRELHSMGATDPDDSRGYFLHVATHNFFVDDGFHDLSDGARRVERVPRR